MVVMKGSYCSGGSRRKMDCTAFNFGWRRAAAFHHLPNVAHFLPSHQLSTIHTIR
jgi:hypothetical protein